MPRRRTAIRRRAGAFAGLALAFVLLAACSSGTTPDRAPAAATPTAWAPAAPTTTGALALRQEDDESQSIPATVIATGLPGPTALAFAPDGRLFIAQSNGQILLYQDGELQEEPAGMLDVAEVADGGLRGLAVDPRFPEDPFVYALYSTTADDGIETRIARLRFEDGQLSLDEVLLDGLRAGETRNGGALIVGPDRMLYAAIGDLGEETSRDDPERLAGAILRLAPDGSVPPDNPSPGSYVYSAGHRHPRGLAWHSESGSLVVVDEAGSEPLPAGRAAAGPAVVTVGLPPDLGASGAEIYLDGPIKQWRGNLFVASAEGERLLRFGDDPAEWDELDRAEPLYEDWLGRLADVALGPDGFLYAITANRADDGDSRPRDDRLVRFVPASEIELLYPDLVAKPPSLLSLERAVVEGRERRVLRFANIIENLGDGPLALSARPGTREPARQQVSTSDGSYIERVAGEIRFHEGHRHWHMEHLNRFEIWERAEYERWLASGRADGEPGWVHDKISMCLFDAFPAESIRPEDAGEPRFTEACDADVQGISVGWGDIYQADLDEQWVVVGEGGLPDGEYVLRVIVDSENLIHESPYGADPARENHEANDATTRFTVTEGRVTIDEGEPEPAGRGE